MSNRYVALENRCLLAIEGADARSFLQGLISQDIEIVTPMHSAYGLLLSAQGKWLFDCFLIARGDAIWIELEATRVQDFKRILSMYKLRANATITDITEQYHTLVAMGDVERLSLTEDAGRTEYFADGDVVAFTDPRLPALGARIIAPIGQGETWVGMRGFAQAMPEDYAQHRIALGVPEGDVDNVPEKTLPMEHGMDALGAISFDKGCFVGQEVTTRTKFRANLQKQLYVVKTQTGELPEAGTAILSGERTVGVLHSHVGQTGLATLRKDSADQSLTANGQTISAYSPIWCD